MVRVLVEVLVGGGLMVGGGGLAGGEGGGESCARSGAGSVSGAGTTWSRGGGNNSVVGDNLSKVGKMWFGLIEGSAGGLVKKGKCSS